MTPNEAAHIVIGAALRVHSALGAGVLESTYDACFYYELTKAGLRFEHQVHLPVVYEGIQLSTAYRVDFIVEGCLVVELKCVERDACSSRPALVLSQTDRSQARAPSEL